MNTATTLDLITQSPRLHASFLNSLSYLEYRGFRKIVRSHSTEQMSFEVLLHTAEEVRHAVFFKRQAVKLGGDGFKTFADESLIAGNALKRYFYEIDARVAKLAEKAASEKLRDAVYYLVTWLVETRATAIYEEYERVLSAGAFGFSLNGILREEEMHLEELGEEAKRVLRDEGFEPERILEIETNEFFNLWTAIEAEVAARACA